MQGESIAPTTDKTMKVIGVGSGGRSSIDPTDYMGNAFIYTEWVKKRQAEIAKEQQKKEQMSIAGQERANVQTQIATLKPQIEKTIADTEKDKSSIEETPEYKKFLEDEAKAKQDWKDELDRTSQTRPTAGAVPVMHFAIDKYNKDLSDARSEMQKATDAVSKATTAAELKVAKEQLETATTKYHEVSNTNPASPEGKEKYKDTLDVEYVEGPKYATGFGLGGYIGTGPQSVAYADQLKANILGVQVGSTQPQKQMSPQEIMASQGYKQEINPVTGNMGWFKTGTDATGKEIKTEFTGTFAPMETGSRTYFVPGISQTKTADIVGLNADMLKDMMYNIVRAPGGGKLTPGQIEDVSNALIAQNMANKSNTLNQLITQYRINPTKENATIAENYAKQVQLSSASDAAKIQASVEAYGKGFEAKAASTLGTTLIPTGPRVGSIGGADIFGSKTTGEFISGAAGKPVSLSDITTYRQMAGKTGEFNVYNFPGAGGARAQDAAAAQARQFLFQNLPGAPVKEERSVRTGSINVDGTSLDIIHKADRGEYVKLNTGNEVPLSVVTNMKELASGTGVYARSPDLRQAELEYLTAYKLASLNNDNESNTNLAIATQNLTSRKDFTQEVSDNISTIQDLGGKFAGIKFDETQNKYVPADENISKALLTFSASNPVQNAISSGILPPEAASFKQFSDIATTIQSRGGDPIIGLIKATRVMADNPYIYDMKPGTRSYDETIEAVSRIAAGGNIIPGEYTLPKNVYSTNVTVTPPKETSVGFKQAGPVNPFATDRSTGVSVAAPKSTGLGVTIGDTSVKNPTIVKDTSKVYVKPSGFSNFFSKGKPLRLSTPAGLGVANVTSLQYRKTKGSKPKLNMKQKKHSIKKPEEKPMFDMDKILGNVSGILDTSNKNTTLVKGIDIKPINLSSFIMHKKKK